MIMIICVVDILRCRHSNI